jgi:hypothetical protein
MAAESLNSENPDRNDGSEHGEAGNRPPRHVNRAVRLRPVHHGIVPMGHFGLLEIASAGYVCGSGGRFNVQSTRGRLAGSIHRFEGVIASMPKCHQI